MNNDETLYIELGDKKFTLQIQQFDTDIDVEQILKIDYANILGEVLTFPVLFNRIGNLKAEYENLVKEKELDMNIFMAEQKKQIRKNLTFTEDRGKNGAKIMAPSVDEVETELKLSPGYRVKQKDYLNALKNLSIIESIYWSAKSKDGKLDKLSEKLRPEEFSMDVLQDTCNGIAIKQMRNNFPDKLSSKK